MNERLFLLIIAVLFLTGCDSRTPDQTAQIDERAPVSTDGPGPDGSNFDRLVYPGSRQAAARFSTPDSIDRVVGWYWNPAQPMVQRNGETWAVSKPEKRDDGYLVQLAIIGENQESFAIYLTPGSSGGTDGRIRPITKEEIRSGVKL